MSTLSKLQKIWYKKLKDSGFSDIEKANGSIGRTKLNLDNRNFDQIEITQQYYSMARSFLIEHHFESELDKVIWEYHIEGISVRNIAKLLSSTDMKIKKKSTVNNIIRRLEQIMKDKYLK